MKLSPAIVFLAACAYLSPSANALPFKRNAKDGEDEAGVAEAVIDYEEVLEIRLPSSFEKLGGSYRNEIVENFFGGTGDAFSDDLLEVIDHLANERHDFLIDTRRNLHRHPEVMYNEHDTSAYIQKTLKAMDIKFTTGWAVNTHPDRIPGKGGYGIVADIGTHRADEPCIILRADMDALPILEKTQGIDGFKSENEGEMHACGHDAHTTMLLGAASILKEMEDSINGTVRLMFQPAEEGGAGAKRMIEEGLLTTDPKPVQAFGMHVWPSIPSGTIATRPGTILAAAEMFEILVSGVGGHAAMPHLTIDPIVTASSIVMNLQTLIARTLSPLESGVVSVTKFEAGDAFNVIPASALLRGTIRALTTETLLSLRDRVEHVVTATANTHGCNVTITYSADYYPPTVNDPTLFEEFSKDVGAMLSKDGKLLDIVPTMGGEDFGFVAEKIPATFFLLGQGTAHTGPPTNYGLHHPHFALDESVLPRGVALHVNLALRALKKLSS
ncbi:unnamed protein product [Cylindrotheca closterium]|uniref:Peptidase M20 dimerisation domain-containing protein n=1 Tax=Cylindrotheca closterium TaxID=2856 RepID=A0AAD2JJI9_9STRA|nr:unnamed protein product [Cylindrotheca closterium]